MLLSEIAWAIQPVLAQEEVFLKLDERSYVLDITSNKRYLISEFESGEVRLYSGSELEFHLILTRAASYIPGNLVLEVRTDLDLIKWQYEDMTNSETSSWVVWVGGGRTLKV